MVVSRETVRLWVNRFGAHFAKCVRRDRSKPNDKWHLDEVVITIRGKPFEKFGSRKALTAAKRIALRHLVDALNIGHV